MAIKYFGKLIFPHFLVTIADVTHPLSNNRSSVRIIDCYQDRSTKWRLKVKSNSLNLQKNDSETVYLTLLLSLDRFLRGIFPGNFGVGGVKNSLGKKKRFLLLLLSLLLLLMLSLLLSLLDSFGLVFL